MAGKVENWPELESLYVIHGKSHRQIAELAGISNSTVSQRARKDDWEGKRQAYKASIALRGYENAAATVANANKAVLEENIIVARAYIRATAQAIRDGTLRPNGKEALEFMRFLVGELRPAAEESPREQRIIEGTAVEVASQQDLLRRLVDEARTRVAAPGGLGADPLEQPPNPRPN